MAYLLASRLCNAIAITRVEGVSIFIFFHRVWFQVKSLKQGVKKQNSVLNREGNLWYFQWYYIQPSHHAPRERMSH